LYIIFILTVTGIFLSYAGNKLTLAGSICGGMIAMLVYFCAGITGYGMMAAFFIMAIVATAYKKSEKKNKTKDHPEKRNARQVLANGGMAATASLLSFYIDHNFLFQIMIACVFSSAAADTVSSEMGMVKGKKFINILSFQRDKKGLDGVISLEGCLWGLMASVLIAGIYYLGFGSLIHSFIIIIGGTIGNLSDSILGATLERKGRIGNDAVNFLNTLIATLTGWILYEIF
jgi:uncharacterized protein (TIGR00297 family)